MKRLALIALMALAGCNSGQQDGRSTYEKARSDYIAELTILQDYEGVHKELREIVDTSTLETIGPAIERAESYFLEHVEPQRQVVHDLKEKMDALRPESESGS